jgi:BirA family transcriptional regulator, biotin operon repressor / biotin---[acetyl-CoA-carboxylase] ligase
MTSPAVLHFSTLDSTNEEAFRQLSAGCEGPLWIVADQQTKGRGRAGREWISPKGNLYASLLMQLSVSPKAAPQISFAAGLAAYDAVASELAPQLLPDLRLKWPNDVLLAGGKIAGILIESTSLPGGGMAAVIGTGINIGLAPAETLGKSASLGADTSRCMTVFGALAKSLEMWLNVWDSSRGFKSIREAWLARAHRPGEPVSVNLNGSLIRGRFHNVDAGGALQLEVDRGVVIAINAGDVFPSTQS